MESQDKQPRGQPQNADTQSDLLSAEDRGKLRRYFKEAKRQAVEMASAATETSGVPLSLTNVLPLMMFDALERQGQIASQMKEYLVSLHSISDKMNSRIKKLHKHSVSMIILTVVIAAFTVALGYYACRLDSSVQHLPTSLPVH